jgi:hypothetical protein
MRPLFFTAEGEKLWFPRAGAHCGGSFGDKLFMQYTTFFSGMEAKNK